jgi:hypothetical protein
MFFSTDLLLEGGRFSNVWLLATADKKDIIK